MRDNQNYPEIIDITKMPMFTLFKNFLNLSNVCVFQCQPTALLRVSGSTQGGYMALSVVYFRITHRLGRPHYVWDEYLHSVRPDPTDESLSSVLYAFSTYILRKGLEFNPGL